MKDGFVKVGVCSPDLKVADPLYNCAKMVEKAEVLSGRGAKLVAFPELSLTGYTCGDLFLQEPLLQGAVEGLEKFARETQTLDSLFVAGLPLTHQGRLFNVAALVFRGKVVGLVPKSHIHLFRIL